MWGCEKKNEKKEGEGRKEGRKGLRLSVTLEVMSEGRSDLILSATENKKPLFPLLFLLASPYPPLYLTRRRRVFVDISLILLGFQLRPDLEPHDFVVFNVFADVSAAVHLERSAPDLLLHVRI